MDSCSTIIHKISTISIINDNQGYWLLTPVLNHSKNLLIYKIKTIGSITTTVKYIGWTAEKINVTVVEDGHQPIIGSDLFSQLDLSLIQSRQINTIAQIERPINTQIPNDLFDCVSPKRATSQQVQLVST